MTSSPILLQVFWLCWPCSHSRLCFTTFLNQLCLLWLSFLWYKWWMWWLWRSSGKLTVSLQGSKEFCRVTYFKRQAGFTLKGFSSLCMIQLWGKILKYLMFNFYHYSIKILSPIWICFNENGIIRTYGACSLIFVDFVPSYILSKLWNTVLFN